MTEDTPPVNNIVPSEDDEPEIDLPINPKDSLSTQWEISAWKRYQSERVGYPDMLEMVGSQKFPDSSRLEGFDIKVALKGDGIYENIRDRFKAKLIYTSIGHQVLIAVNPCDLAQKKIEKDKELKKAKDGQTGKVYDGLAGLENEENFLVLLEPEKQLLINDPRANHIVQDHNQAHIFTYATRCYWHMVRQKQDQIVVFAGEAGSGKTTTNKLFLLQLLNVSQQYAYKVGAPMVLGEYSKFYHTITRKLVASLQLIDLFSSAQTPLNPDASRIHKYTELLFSKTGKLVGAKIVDFLLEKRRVAQAFKFTRYDKNFHIFYELFAPGQLSREMRERMYLLDSAKNYKYLVPSGDVKFKRGYDGGMHPPTVSITKLLTTLRFSADEQEDLFKILSAIILLGNIEFAIYEAKKEEGVYVKTTDTLDKCAILLGVSTESLETTITQKTGAVAGTLCVDFLTIDEAQKSRDLLAITLYSLLFDYLMIRINSQLNATGDKIKWENWIATIDLGGQEDLSRLTADSVTQHRFWHLLTNFAQDRLQYWIHCNIYQFADLVSTNTRRPMPPAIDETLNKITESLSNLQLLYGDPANGIFTITDRETAKKMNGSSTAPDVSFNLLDQITNANNQQDTPKQKKLAKKSGTAENPNMLLMPGPTDTSFSIKHYSGFNHPQLPQPQSFHKIIYESADFCHSNILGGRGKGSRAIRPDFVRMIKGTADFTSAKNKFLVRLVDKQVKVNVHPSGKNIILQTEKDSIGLFRSPSIRDDCDEKKLSSIMSENKSSNNSSSNSGGGNNNSLFKQVLKNQHKKVESTDSKTTTSSKVKVNVSTVAAEYYYDLNTLLDILQDNGDVRHWYVFCIRPNDEFSDKKWQDERVREQLKRFNAPFLLMKSVGEFSVSFTWREFLNRYGKLYKNEDNKLSKRKSTFSLANATDLTEMKAHCRSVYEMYAIITGGGSGKVVTTEDRLFMNERSWWALERNLIAVELDKVVSMGIKETLVDSEIPVETELPDINSRKQVADQMNDAETAAKERRMKQLQQSQLSEQRIWWLRITTALTWWVPTWTLQKFGGMERPEVIQAWREKLALCLLIGLLTLVMLFMLVWFASALCPTKDIYTLQDLQQKAQNKQANLTAIHGQVYDIESLGQHGQFKQQMVGRDVTIMFPRRSDPYVFPPGCGRAGSSRPVTIQFPKQFCFWDNVLYRTQRPPCHWDVDTLLPSDKSQLPVYGVKYYGKLAHNREDVKKHSSTADAWVVVREGDQESVYDVSDALVAGILSVDDATFLATMAGRGTAIDPSEVDWLNSINFLQCMQQQMFVGVIDSRGSLTCQIADNTLLSLTVILCSVMLAKFLAALQLGTTPQPEEQKRLTIIQIPCYTEGEESLKKTINSCALMDYDDDQKLLFIIADGLIKGSGNDRMTPEIVLDILGVENSHDKIVSDKEQPRFDYLALGDGMNRLNRAKVFSGFYKIETRSVPYIVVVKCGKESETRRPGNRGKRDSQLIMMKFLNKVFYDRPMQPLEVELFRQIKEVIGQDPGEYVYCLMVDADTEVMPDSLTRLIAYMIHDSRIMGLCGETTIGNEEESWVTMIQVYEYYISHHLAKSFESLFGSVTCLPGCFCMYRIKSPGQKSIPLIIDDNVIHDYEENQVDTLHKKNLLSLGEDRYLTTLMLKYFPKFRNKFTPDAICKTIAPDKFMVLLSQRRRWINSTIHNLWELLLIPQLCGCLCFSMRFVVFLDLFGTLTMPGSLAYLGYLIYDASTKQDIDRVTMSLILFGAVYGCQAVIFLLRLKWAMIGWMVIYVLSLPVYGIALPIYAFWHFDDFSWGNTRVILGEKAGGGHGGPGDGEVFDEKSIILAKYDQKKAKKSIDKSETMIAKSSSIQPPPQQQPESNQQDAGDGDGDSSTAQYQHPTIVRPIYVPIMPQMNPVGFPVVNTQPHMQQYQQFPMPPISPLSPSIQPNGLSGNSLKDLLLSRASPDSIQNGLFKSLLPLPESISPAFARLIMGEIIAVVEFEDLRSLTKKKVRTIVEANLIAQYEQLKADESSADCDQDWSELLESGVNVSFDLDAPDRRQWIGKCIVDILKRIAELSPDEEATENNDK